MQFVRVLRSIRDDLPSVQPLGFGLWWAAWFAARMMGAGWLSTGQHGLVQDGSVLGLMSALYALAFLLLVAFGKRLAPLRQRRALLVVAAVVAGIGLALISLNGMQPFGPVGQLVGLSLAAIAAAVVVMAWVELYGAMGARRACIGICSSLLIAAVLFAIAITLGPLAPLPTTVILASCPVLSVVSLLGAWRDAGIPRDDLAARQEPFRMPIAPMVGMFVYAFAVGFMVMLTAAHASLGLSFNLLSAACKGAIALAVLLYTVSRRTLDFRFMYWSILLFLAMGFMLLPVAGYGDANALVTAGYACLAISWITVCSDIIHRVHAPALVAGGWSAFANYGGAVAGGLACSALLGRVTLGVWQLSVVAIVMVSLLMLTSTLLLSETSVADLWGLVHTPTPAMTELPESLVEGRCAQVAAANGLTPREREILVLLAQGRTTEEIGESLVISAATVRTHAKRIHEKLGVHSQPQLIRMIVFDSQTAEPVQA